MASCVVEDCDLDHIHSVSARGVTDIGNGRLARPRVMQVCVGGDGHGHDTRRAGETGAPYPKRARHTGDAAAGGESVGPRD